MLMLAAANAVGVLLFGTLYAVAGAHLLSQGAFFACLVTVFALVTALWVRTEARHRSLEPLRRLGRVAVGLVIAIIGVPAGVLMPLFWLDTNLPAEAGLTPVLGPIMTLVLFSLMLVVLVNVIGSVVVAGRALLGSRSTRQG